jgi:hypothetical protein
LFSLSCVSCSVSCSPKILKLFLRVYCSNWLLYWRMLSTYYCVECIFSLCFEILESLQHRESWCVRIIIKKKVPPPAVHRCFDLSTDETNSCIIVSLPSTSQMCSNFTWKLTSLLFKTLSRNPFSSSLKPFNDIISTRHLTLHWIF